MSDLPKGMDFSEGTDYSILVSEAVGNGLRIQQAIKNIAGENSIEEFSIREYQGGKVIVAESVIVLKKNSKE